MADNGRAGQTYSQAPQPMHLLSFMAGMSSLPVSSPRLKSEITFAILWIVAYVVLSSYADQLSESIGIIKSATAVLQIVMSLVLFFWIRSNNLSEKYGFCRPKVSAKQFLYYLPLIVIASTALWGGIKLQYGFPDALLYVISMCCVG